MSAGAAAPHTAPLVAGLIPAGEPVVVSLRPSLWYVLLSRLGLIAWLAGIGAGAWLLRDALRLGDAAAATAAWGAGGCAALALLYGAIDWATRAYVLTRRRVIAVSGIVRQTAVELPLSRVQNLVVHRRVRERVLGLGTLVFVSAHDGLGAVGWSYVSGPGRLLAKVREALDHAEREP